MPSKNYPADKFDFNDPMETARVHLDGSTVRKLAGVPMRASLEVQYIQMNLLDTIKQLGALAMPESVSSQSNS